ncbi:MAG: hypothetical protein KJ587_06765 [Alphaproteobacteria bacterium]|nr:hypothetical protein [Alphaproteobacteria bacterium]
MSFEPIWLPGGVGREEPCKIESHPAYERMLARLPSEGRASFTTAQLAMLAEASRPPSPRHWIDYRVSLPFFGARYYLTIFFGKERRLLSRILCEGQASVTKASIAYVMALWVLMTTGLVAALVFLYVVKSAIGIDFFDGPSFLHGYAYVRWSAIDVGNRLLAFL